MANPNRQNLPPTTRSEQNALNSSFDEEFDILATELVAYNTTSNSLQRVKIDDSGALVTSATLSGGGGDGAILDGASPTTKATVRASSVDGTKYGLVVVNPDGSNIGGGSGGSGTQYADGAARGTATGTLAMGDDGTNIQSVKVDSSGVLAIQDNGGSITVDGTVTANTGLTQPLTDTQLRASAVPVSGTITETNSAAILAKLPNVGQATMAASQPVVIASNQSAVTIQGTQDSRSTGTITTAASVVGPVSVTNRNLATVDISGTYAGVTFIIEASADGGTTYFPLQAINNATGLAANTWTPGTNASATYDAAIGGFTNLRVRATAWTSGTANVGITLQTFAYDPVVASITQGTTATGSAITGAGNPVYVAGSDGTNVRPVLTSTSGVQAAQITGATGTAMLPTAAASADALANPTITQIGADNMVFNGTSWDRQRGMSVATTTGDTGAKTATGNGATQTNVGNKGLQLVINMGAVTGTTPTCTLKVQGSVDGGTNWYDIPGATTAALTATGIYGITVYPGATVLAGTTTTGTTAVASNVVPRTWRVVWTIGGTTPSFTITSITYNYLPN